jgi:hypothetical protein
MISGCFCTTGDGGGRCWCWRAGPWAWKRKGGTSSILGLLAGFLRLGEVCVAEDDSVFVDKTEEARELGCRSIFNTELALEEMDRFSLALSSSRSLSPFSTAFPFPFPFAFPFRDSWCSPCEGTFDGDESEA